MPSNTYTLIEKITVGAAGASEMTFTNIPQTYTDLYVKLSARSTGGFVSNAVDSAIMYFNTDTSSTTNYSARTLSSGAGTPSSDTTKRGAMVNGSGTTASTFSNSEYYIPNYTGSNNKSVSIDGVTENNSTAAYANLEAWLWSNTAAITTITLKLESGSNFTQYSTAYLYGIAKEGVTPTPSSAPYATGGDSIVFDGTYWIHTFTSSGTFTPKKSLTCDYLVVAGGGGSGSFLSGGGGAGGLRSTVTATGGGGSLESALALTANTGYTVTVGAGGAAGSGGKGSNGSDSVFSSITSTGGGASNNNDDSSTPNSGGSGGGGAPNSSGGGSGGGYNGASGTTNQGYAGGRGNGAGGGSNYNGGGGGGAGGVGTAASQTDNGVYGTGGAGVATSISGTSVTYAGGGGGCNDYASSRTSGGSGGGGLGGNDTTAGTDGTANTGGGAGGAGRTGGGKTGGSGIVIVRYAA